MTTNLPQSNSSAQTRFRDRISDLDRRALYALIAATAEKSDNTEVASIARAAAHELGIRRDQARARGDEAGYVRWAGILTVIADDPEGFKGYVASVIHWATMSQSERAIANRPTEKQIQFLNVLGHTGEMPTTRKGAADLIDRLKRVRRS